MEWKANLRARAARSAARCGLDLVTVDCSAFPCLTVWQGVGQGELRRCEAWRAEVDPAFAYLRLWVVDDAEAEPPPEPERLLVFVDYPVDGLPEAGAYGGDVGDRLTDAAAEAMEERGLRLRTPDEVLDDELRRVLDIADGDLDHPAVQAVLARWNVVETNP